MPVRVLSVRGRELLAGNVEPERVLTGFQFTEGPLWDPRDQSLLFSDIPADCIYRWLPGAPPARYRAPSGKSNGLTWDLEGRLLACEHARRRVSRTDAGGAVQPFVDQYRGRRLNSPNDLVLRSDGMLYFSDPPYGLTAEFGIPGEPEQDLNALYLLRPGETDPDRAAEDFDRPNGLAFTPGEDRLYVADTPRYEIRVFDVEADGTLTGGGLFHQFQQEQGIGRPDGMKVDAEGNLYTTGPGGLWILAPDGEPLVHVVLPEKAANCAWGGPEYQDLFITATTSIYRLRTHGFGASHRLAHETDPARVGCRGCPREIKSGGPPFVLPSSRLFVRQSCRFLEIAHSSVWRGKLPRMKRQMIIETDENNSSHLTRSPGESFWVQGEIGAHPLRVLSGIVAYRRGGVAIGLLGPGQVALPVPGVNGNESPAADLVAITEARAEETVDGIDPAHLSASALAVVTGADRLGNMSLPQRLAALLVDIHDLTGQSVVGCRQDILAMAAAARRETVATILSGWRDEGWIETRYRRCKIMDRDALVRVREQQE